MGKQHLALLLTRLDACHNESEGWIVIFDLGGVKSATGSYLRATVLWLLEAGRRSVNASTGLPASTGIPEDDEPIPLNIYPVLAGLSEDVTIELDYVLPKHGLACLEAIDWDSRRISEARLHGTLDRSLRKTLSSLASETAGATAPQLCEKHPEEQISPTGWNNRLVDLHALRLAHREKQGRFWVYHAVADNVIV